MEQNKIYILDMEEELEKDVNGDYRKKILDSLLRYSAEIKQQMDSGLPPDEFKTSENIKGAVDTASDVVDKVWNLFHQ